MYESGSSSKRYKIEKEQNEFFSFLHGLFLILNTFFFFLKSIQFFFSSL